MTLSKPLKTLAWTIITLIAALLLVLTSIWWVLTGSKATLDGTILTEGIDNKAYIQRDAQGIVSINGQSRNDIAFSLGFAHAQERFFQMDLLRKNSAGELSALFGARAVSFDKKIRIHQFRKRALAAVNALPDDHRDMLVAYSQGVNSGVSALRSKSFEYQLLRAQPEPWQPADSFLVVYSMYMDLQDEFAEGERSLTAMYDLLPQDWFNFLNPVGGLWDATLDNGDLSFDTPFPGTPLARFQEYDQASVVLPQYEDRIEVGSNNWSVSGELTRHGSALVADDMHLGLDVPNIWFRASWALPDENRQITGVTLPGAPLMIIGSTENIAWGFTNSYGDYLDVIRLQTNAEQSEYLTNDGWIPFDTEEELITVKGGDTQSTTIKKTRWGPVIGEDHFGNLIALRWIAHDPEALNLNLLLLEEAENVDDALEIAAKTGIPGQNLNVGDREGNIGWTIMGALPDRQGYPTTLSSQLSADWSNGSITWNGKLSDELYPRIFNPESHRLWTANARMVTGENYQKIGEGMGALGARQQQIRDRLLEIQRFSEVQFLAIHLDDEAIFLDRWQKLLLATLSEQTVLEHPSLKDFRIHIADWKAHADSDSVGYLLVKRFRERVIDQTVGHVFRHVAEQSSEFWMGRVDNKVEYPVWKLVTEKPSQHRPKGFDSWDDVLVSAAMDVDSELSDPETGLTEQTWGNHNALAIQHPLSTAIPILSQFLDMPAQPMSGDTFMPRVQARSSGASQRMAVSPGHEESGYFHMPTGQSGHPLSPFYRVGHEDWVAGNPSPFLPGETEYILELIPRTQP